MRAHVVRHSDDLVVNTIIVDVLPTATEDHRYVACDGGAAGPGCWIDVEGHVTFPGVEPAVDTVKDLAAQLADLQARLVALQESAS